MSEKRAYWMHTETEQKKNQIEMIWLEDVL